MKIELKLDANCTETKVIIVADKMTNEISELMRRLAEEKAHLIPAYSDNSVRLLEESDIVRIFSASGKVYAITDASEYHIKLRLYEVEERLKSKTFVRISNSEIINLIFVKKFDLSCN